MTWDYRVVKTRDCFFDEAGKHYGETWTYQIHEAYYSKKGRVRSITVEPMAPQGHDLKSLRQELKRFMKALDAPVINEEKFMKRVNKRRQAKGLPPWRPAGPSDEDLTKAAIEMIVSLKPDKKGKK